jgi:hypothetical protein
MSNLLAATPRVNSKSPMIRRGDRLNRFVQLCQLDLLAAVEQLRQVRANRRPRR